MAYLTKPQIRIVYYTAFYRVCRQVDDGGRDTSLKMEKFFASKIKDTWPKSKPPGDWPDFWFEAVAVEMQSGLMTRGVLLDELDGAWLKEQDSGTWDEVVDFTYEEQISLDFKRS